MSEQTYEIQRLGHEGFGIAEGPIFVLGALPGEVVTGDVSDKRILRPKVLTPSAQRVAKPCSHAGVCGGCALQHASDAFVENWKLARVQTALQAQGLDVGITKVHTSPPQSRRRAVLHGKRTKSGAMVGFYGRASNTLHEVPNCLVLRPALVDALPALQEITILGASRRSEIDLTVTEFTEGLDLCVEKARDLDQSLEQELSAWMAKWPIVRLSWNGVLIAQRENAGLSLDGVKILPPPAAFLQATLEGEAALRSAMLRAVQGAKRVVDLFSGCGTFSLPLAKTAQVHAVEGLEEMLSSLSFAARQHAGLKPLTTETRDLFRRPLLPDELDKFDAAVIDPPRAGAQAQCEEIAQSQLQTVGFVSCNPITFARDAKILTDAGFEINWIEVVDQFRWSSHVELAAQFTRGT